MRFPKAYNGVKLLFIAEILSLVVVMMAICLTTVALLPDMGGLSFSVFRGVMALCFLPTLPMSIAAVVLIFVGLSSAKAEEPKFKTAMIFMICSLVSAFVMAFVMIFSMVLSIDFSVNPPAVPQPSGVFSVFPSIIGSILSACAFIFIASGVINLAEKLGDEPMAAAGRRFQRVYVVFTALSAIVNIVSYFVRRGSPNAAFNYMSLISFPLTLALAVITIVFLGRAKNMLAR